MASLAVVQWKGHAHMAKAAEPPLQAIIHGKMLGGLLLDVEDVRMAILAIEPCCVRCMREDGRGNQAHFGF